MGFCAAAEVGLPAAAFSNHFGETIFDGNIHGRTVAVESVRLWLRPRRRVHWDILAFFRFVFRFFLSLYL